MHVQRDNRLTCLYSQAHRNTDISVHIAGLPGDISDDDLTPACRFEPGLAQGGSSPGMLVITDPAPPTSSAFTCNYLNTTRAECEDGSGGTAGGTAGGVCRACVVPATAVSRLSRIRCLSPRRPDILSCDEAGVGLSSCTMYVEIALDGQAFSSQQSPFLVSPALQMTALTISSAPFAGGSVVTVHGQNFQEVGSLTCRFGPHTFVAGNYGAGMLVRGDYIHVKAPSLAFLDCQHLRCTTPPLLLDSQAALTLTLSVSIDGESFTSSRPFIFFPTPILSGIRPSLAEPRGGSLVTVVGQRFLPFARPPSSNLSSSPLQCKFGETASGSKVTPASFVSSTAVRCQTPPQPGEQLFLAVSLTLNAHQFHAGLFDRLQSPGLAGSAVRIAYYQVFDSMLQTTLQNYIAKT